MGHSAILEAYRRLENATDQALRRAGVEPPRSPAARRQLLEGKGIVTGSTGALLDDLRGLRNLAAHADDFRLTSSQAVEYAQLSKRLLSAINVSSEGLDKG